MGSRSKPLVIVQAYEDRPLNAYTGTTTTPRIQSPAKQPNVVTGPSRLNGAIASPNIPVNASNGLNGISAVNGINGVSKPNGLGPANVNIANGVPGHNGVSRVNGVSSPEPPKKSLKPPGQPPPPPPMPVPDNIRKQEVPHTNGIKSPATHKKLKAPPPPPAKKPQQNGTHRPDIALPDKPPATPTPDYDTSSLVKVISKPKLIKAKSDAVEMESLESFKLTNPSSPTPRPPNTYFMKQPSGTLTMKKANPQVSVTIGEYPTNTFRKQPSKLEFLSNDAVDGPLRKDEPVGSRLQSELVQTLSRSNLKKKTENDLLMNGGSKMKSQELAFDSILSEPNANFHKRYGHVISPLPPSINIPKVPIAKSLSHNTMMNGGSNRLSVSPSLNGNGKIELTKTESLPHGGILKNSTPMFLNERNAAFKMSAQQKSIKFGQTTTVIGDPEVPLIANH